MNPSRKSIASRHWLVALNCLVACCLATGCAMTGRDNDELTELTEQPEVQGSYVVEFQSNSQKPTVKNFPLVGSPTIQDALEQSGALDKFGQCDIVLIRTIPGTQRRHKMEVNFDSKHDRVPPEQNYALHPNDHLVVNQASTDPLESILPGGLGVFGK